MRMMKKGEETEVDNVTWEDQEKINTFGKLSMKLEELQEDFDSKKVYNQGEKEIYVNSSKYAFVSSVEGMI